MLAQQPTLGQCLMFTGIQARHIALETKIYLFTRCLSLKMVHITVLYLNIIQIFHAINLFHQKFHQKYLWYIHLVDHKSNINCFHILVLKFTPIFLN